MVVNLNRRDEMIPQIRSPFGLRENLAVFFRYKRGIVLTCILAVTVTLALSILQSRVYESSARLLVQQKRTAIPVSATFSAPMQINPFNQKDRIRTEMQIFQSTSVIGPVVDSLGPEYVLEKMHWRWDPLREFPRKVSRKIRGFLSNIMPFLGGPSEALTTGPRRKAVEKVSKHLLVEPVREADVFEVSLQAPDPEFAADLLNLLLDRYQDRRIEVRQGNVTNEMFSEESERVKSELRQATKRLHDFKIDTGIVSASQQKRIMLERLSEIENELLNTELEKNETKQRILEIERQLETLSPDIALEVTSFRNPELDYLDQQLSQLEIRKSQFVPDSQLEISIESEIQAVKKRIAKKQTEVSGSQVSGVNQTYQDLQKTLLSLRDKLRGLEGRRGLQDTLDKHRQQLFELDANEAMMDELELSVKLREDIYRVFMKKQEETRLEQLLDTKRVSNVALLEEALAPDWPKRPRILLNLIVGIVAGLFGGFGIAYLKDFFRRNLTTPEEVERALGKPVLAALLTYGNTAEDDAANGYQTSRFCNALLQMNKKNLRSFLITSTRKAEGKSLVVEKTSRELLDRGYSVAVVGDVPLGDGLTTEATGERATLISQFTWSEIDNRSQTLDRNRKNTPAILADILDQYDIILVDGQEPAKGGLPREFDSTIIVIEAEKTPMMSVSHSVRTIEDSGGNIGGFVLNRCRHVIPKWVYNMILTSDGKAKKG